MSSFTLSNTIYNAVKTNNPIIDGIIGCIVTSLVYQIMFMYPQIIKWIKKKLEKKRKMIYDMNIYQNVPLSNNQMTNNTCYIGIKMYLNTVTNITGTMRVEKCSGSKLLFSIDTTVIKTEFENSIIWIEFIEKEANIEKNILVSRYYRISTYSSNEVLKKLIRHCVALYNEHYKKVPWTSSKMLLEETTWHGYSISNTKTFDNLILDASLKSTLQNDIVNFMNNKEWYKKKGIAWTRGYLLYGTPGCGKTSIIKTISNEYKLPLYIMNLSTIYSDDVLSKAFSGLPPKCIVVLEDIDCMSDISHKRESCETRMDDKKIWKTITLSCLLNELDGLSNASGRIVIMTTNHVEKLDPALIRPGRIDMRIELKPCSVEMICNMYKLIFDSEIDYNYIPHLKNGVLTPAEVMNMFMSLPKNTAMERLIELLDSHITKQ